MLSCISAYSVKESRTPAVPAAATASSVDVSGAKGVKEEALGFILEVLDSSAECSQFETGLRVLCFLGTEKEM